MMIKSLVLLGLAALLGLTADGEAADFDGDSRDDIAVFRPSSGRWNIRGYSTFFFGNSEDTPSASDLDGDGMADPTLHRASDNLWRVRNKTRFYFGNASLGDEPVSGGGGGQRTYDYVVKAGDGSDLVRALESDTYRSVFIPTGTYWVNESISVDNVRRISGEDMIGTLINFGVGVSANLRIEESYCTVENLSINSGGTSAGGGAFYVNADCVTVQNCMSIQSSKSGFEYSATADYPSFVSCRALMATLAGFGGIKTVKSSSLVNCSAYDCGDGFVNCNSLSNCYVDGNNNTDYGYYFCEQISSSRAVDCATNGFRYCSRLSACTVDGMDHTTIGFSNCSFLSSCYVLDVTGDTYYECNFLDPDSCH